jgi:hypothetical protein
MEAAMTRTQSFACAAALIVAAFAMAGFQHLANAAEPMRLEQKKIIASRICGLGSEMCVQSCNGTKNDTECRDGCAKIQNDACHYSDRAAEAPRMKSSKGISEWICEQVTKTTCKWISCSGQGFDQTQCREECNDIIVNSCHYM